MFEGEGVNVEATIPGSKYPDECVMFIAHTSAGTRPGANCAAGPSLMLEIARTINELIKNNIIPEPIRSIKFLFIAEGKGSNVYIDENLKNIKNIKTIFCTSIAYLLRDWTCKLNCDNFFIRYRNRYNRCRRYI